MFDLSVLSLAIFLPIVGALYILLFVNKGDDKANYHKRVFNNGLIFSSATFLITLYMLFVYDKSSSDFQFVDDVNLIYGYDIAYKVGVDGLSLLMIALTGFLTPICFLISINSIKFRFKEYVIAFLLLESFVIASFAALDLVLFYLFFEAMLIPMFLIIGIWGGPNRIYAAFKFFLYTFVGSVLFLIAVIFIYSKTGSADILIIKDQIGSLVTSSEQKWLWLALFVAFAVKIPMFPFHTWLPDAHVQAPTAGSVILAGVLIKIGAYGFLRFSLPFFPQASQYFAPLMFALGVTAIIYASFVALMQKDMKKMIAYSSVAHMGYVVIGIFSLNHQGIDGAIMQMVSHGLVSAALFLCVGVVYERLHTKEIAMLGGLVDKMPRYALYLMLFTMASVGLPSTSGFVGEFLTIIGAFKANMLVGILAAVGVILGAAYMLWLYKRVVFGVISNDKINNVSDLTLTENLIFAAFAVFILLLGIYPVILFDFTTHSVNEILNIFN